VQSTVRFEANMLMYKTAVAGFCLILGVCAEEVRGETQNLCVAGEGRDGESTHGVLALQKTLSSKKVKNIAEESDEDDNQTNQIQEDEEIVETAADHNEENEDEDASQVRIGHKANACHATVYGHDDFQGWSATFPPGSYDLAAARQRGFRNDHASSIIVTPNCTAVLYQHNFAGWSATFPPGRYNMSAALQRGFVNDDASSIRVIEQDICCFSKGSRLTCNAGYSSILSIGDCDKACKNFGYRCFLQNPANSDARPKGCYVAYGDQVYFNNHSSPNRAGPTSDNQADILCRLEQ